MPCFIIGTLKLIKNPSRLPVNFKYVSNNPGYDLSKINVEFSKRGYEYPLQEMFLDYVSVSDPTEQIRQMCAAQRQDIFETVTAVHDHWPLNDATAIYQAMCGIEREQFEY